jgi:threonine/homoserine/homoserine lactone efflux protein
MMSDLWLELLPIAVAMAMTPGRLLALLLLFKTGRPGLTSTAFVGGMGSNMLIEGLVFALIFSITGVFDAGDATGPPAILAILLIVMGILMLVAAAKVKFHKEDEDKAPPDWLSEIESFTPAKSFRLGLGWLFVSPKQWIFTLTAVGFIFAATLDPLISLLNYLLFILIALTLFILLILVYIILGQRSQEFMTRLFHWLKKNAQTILLLVLFLFGLYFLLKGIMALAA